MRFVHPTALLAVIVGLAIAACAPAASTAGQAPTNGTAPSVVVTNSILGDLARNIAGTELAITVLVPAGADAHTYEPSPADLSALREADLIIEHGMGFEGWLDRVYTASGSHGQRIVATAGITPLAADPHDEHEPHTSSAAGDAAEVDPHVWHDVQNAIQMASNVRDALVSADPERADRYRANAEEYIVELQALDQYVVDQTQQIPQERRKLVTAHDTFRYFGARYGFEIVGTAFGAVSTEASDPSAGQIAELVEQIRTAGVPVIFAENVQNPGLMQRIASEAGVRLGPTLYTDALGEPGSDGDSYVKMIRHNVDAIVGALR